MSDPDSEKYESEQFEWWHGFQGSSRRSGGSLVLVSVPETFTRGRKRSAPSVNELLDSMPPLEISITNNVLILISSK